MVVTVTPADRQTAIIRGSVGKVTGTAPNGERVTCLDRAVIIRAILNVADGFGSVVVDVDP